MTRSSIAVRAVVAAAAPLLALVPLLLGAVWTPAEAGRTLGTVTVDPTSGTVDDVLSLKTSGGCPAAAKMSKARIVGPGFPLRGQNMSGVAIGFTSATKPFKVDAGFTLKDVAALVYPPVTYNGAYRVEVVCLDNNGGEQGVFVGSITFSNPLQWKATAATTPVKPGPTVVLPTISVSSSPEPSSSSSSAASPSPTPTATDASPTDGSGAVDPGATDGTGGSGTTASSTSASQSSALPIALAAGIAGAALGAGAMSVLNRRRSHQS